MKRAAAVAVIAAVALFVACDTAPHHDITLTFNDAGDRVTIEATTTLPPLKEAKDRKQVEQLRDALLGGNDEWALRFQHAAPEHDRVSYDRSAGELTTVTRSATIDADDLQKFFYDLTVTTKIVRGDGWVELAIYPGTSNRASREDRENFEKRLDAAAAAARRYINSMRILYEYLDEHPRRARDVFDALFAEEDNEKDKPRLLVVTRTELELVQAVQRAMSAVFEIDWNGATREADVVSNPFPAELVVKTPSEPTLVEGFARDERGLYIRPKLLMEAIGALEGKWISPDPLGIALRSPGMSEKEIIDVMANSKRHAEPVVGLHEVLAGLREQLKPADRYRVRFLTKSSAP